MDQCDKFLIMWGVRKFYFITILKMIQLQHIFNNFWRWGWFPLKKKKTYFGVWLIKLNHIISLFCQNLNYYEENRLNDQSEINNILEVKKKTTYIASFIYTYTKHYFFFMNPVTETKGCYSIMFNTFLKKQISKVSAKTRTMSVNVLIIIWNEN